MYLIDFLVDPLEYTFMQRALLVTVTASIVCAVLSCWLVLIGWSLMGDAVSHAVLPGVALSYLFGAPFAIGALLFALIAVGAIGVVRNTTIVKEDAAIGVVFTTLFALGVVLISKFPSQIDLNHILFGNLLGVSQADMVQVFVLGGIALVVMIVKRRDFTLFAFDRTQARAVGINPTVISAVMLTLLALTTVVALQAVGVILVVAMLITPGASAYLLTHSFGRMLVLAPLISVGCALVGIYASFYLDVSSGGSVVLTQGLVFVLAYLFSPSQGIVVRALRQRGQVPVAPAG
ncbi:metal ABC transporter permease [Rhodococcus sp. IEGM 1401]|uniref:Metal ABC transporter permease n=2 Tax=Rhodococcus TaxID=1827 RepID=A0ABU4ASR2_9NOCA|nr:MULTISPECIES: metal ABC transporter permease [Rhodococcus]KAA0926678.1 metal ABC transporter permease [Rhodococcus sp. ANT_H53B]MCZ4559607.1 metal ABC transporter permease [Rhodococcus sp. IEGM 1401]MDI9919440.1 metal ABC transporter permease [Rhodococcus sp. IEGM 1372]MDI9924896.1 metal ABC transporter permease [Rhodococcus sp. IEGM 1341]MDV6229282.1 metal ABC transporter permease [Rhodococcus cercidiphylli]